MSASEVYNLVCIISASSVFAPIVVSLLKFKVLNTPLRTLFIFLVFCLAADLVSFFLFRYEQMTNVIVNSFTILESGAISFIYYKMYNKPFARACLAMAYLIFLIVAYYVFIAKGGIYRSDEIVSAFEAGLITIISGSYFIKIFSDENNVRLGEHYFYWINLSFLIYFVAAILVFKGSAFIDRCGEPLSYYLYGLHQVFNFICNLLFSVGIWKKKAI